MQRMGCIATLIYMLTIIHASADDSNRREGWWGSIMIGQGVVDYPRLEKDETSDHGFLGFSFGYAVMDRLSLGVELSGWRYKAFDLNDPAKGEGLSQAYLCAILYPFSETGFFTKVSGGFASYYNHAIDFPVEEERDGYGFGVGMGYDWPVHDHILLTAVIDYNQGDLDGKTFSAVTGSVGITLY